MHPSFEQENLATQHDYYTVLLYPLILATPTENVHFYVQ